MTIKHFIEFADKLKCIQDPYKKQVILDFLLDILPMFNSRFNSSKFKDWVNNNN